MYTKILDVSITVDTIESCPTMRTLGTEHCPNQTEGLQQENATV